MSQQVLSAIERRAIWEAHGKRCNYCRVPVLFRDFHIDHLILEYLNSDGDKLEALSSEVVVGPDFG